MLSAQNEFAWVKLKIHSVVDLCWLTCVVHQLQSVVTELWKILFTVLGHVALWLATCARKLMIPVQSGHYEKADFSGRGIFRTLSKMTAPSFSYLSRDVSFQQFTKMTWPYAISSYFQKQFLFNETTWLELKTHLMYIARYCNVHA